MQWSVAERNSESMERQAGDLKIKKKKKRVK
jgi:hypothetical protein